MKIRKILDSEIEKRANFYLPDIVDTHNSESGHIECPLCPCHPEVEQAFSNKTKKWTVLISHKRLYPVKNIPFQHDGFMEENEGIYKIQDASSQMPISFYKGIFKKETAQRLREQFEIYDYRDLTHF